MKFYRVKNYSIPRKEQYTGNDFFTFTPQEEKILKITTLPPLFIL